VFLAEGQLPVELELLLLPALRGQLRELLVGRVPGLVLDPVPFMAKKGRPFAKAPWKFLAWRCSWWAQLER
jgi:hypothetical protein